MRASVRILHLVVFLGDEPFFSVGFTGVADFGALDVFWVCCPIKILGLGIKTALAGFKGLDDSLTGVISTFLILDFGSLRLFLMQDMVVVNLW